LNIARRRREKERMKSNIEKVVALLIALMFLVGVLPTYAGVPNVPHNANAMWIEYGTETSVDITTADLKVGDNFTVTVWVNITSVASTVQVVGSWQVYAIWNKEYLECVDVGLTAGAKSQFFENISTYGWSPTFGSYNDTHDYFMGGEMWNPMAPAPNPKRNIPGYGSLCWLKFRILKAPEKYGKIESLISISEEYHPPTSRTYVLDDEGTEVDMTVYDCPYIYTWAPPTTNPYMVTDPATITFDKYHNYTDTTFDVDLNIMELDAAWGLTNVSITLTYDPTYYSAEAVTFDPIWNVETLYDISTPGVVTIFAETDQAVYAPPPLTVATVTFRVIYHFPYPPAEVITYLHFESVIFYDHYGQIPAAPSQDGELIMEGIITLPLPWLEVVPNEITLGPEPVVGDTFQVEIQIKNLHFAWYLIGWQCNLNFDPDLLEPVKAEEGPYLKQFPQNPDKPQTYFVANEYYGYISLGGMILPNRTATPPAYTEPLPGAEPPENGTVAIITFQVLKQCNCWIDPQNYTTTLEISQIGTTYFIDKDGGDIPSEDPVHGKVTILALSHAERQIDLYGGANNAGHGVVNAPFPDPYGGQGLNKPMDLVIPQSEVYLYAQVTYNWWPVQNKYVAFEIIDNHNATWAKFVALTNKTGIASVTFRMPWICSNPEYYLGEWTVVATVDLYDVVITDIMTFHYDYMVRLWNVTTNKDCYAHGEYIEVTVEYGTHAMQEYPALFTITVTDEVGVPIGINATYSIMVGGAEYCTYNNNSFTVTILIPKWAAAGYAYIHVNVFDKEPAEGGFAWCPEYEPAPKICIVPEEV